MPVSVAGFGADAVIGKLADGCKPKRWHAKAGAVTRVMRAIGELGQLHDLPADIRGLVLAEDDVGPYEYLV